MPPFRPPLIVALLALFAVAALAHQERGAALAGAALLGGFAGFALYHASFGFTAAWRRVARERRGAGLRAQMLLIGLTCLVSFPLMAHGDAIGADARGYILPMGVASALGAFVFGAGMQLGGGCASGTLFTVGGGSTRMVLVLIFFIAGSLLATAHWEFWTRPAPEGADPAYAALRDVVSYRINDNRGVSLVRELGAAGAIAVMALVLGAIALCSAIMERRAHGALETPKRSASLLTGPWSLVAGAVALAVVGVGCFLILGRPWGVTAGFALWGAKAYEGLGGDVSGWVYWSGWRSGQLDASLFANGTSVMNFGIVAGAMAAAALAGKWAPVWRLSTRDVATAVIGGLMMGYGARLAYGCNIGAYLGGLVSGSLHGWWWLVWGFAGSYLGVWMRGRLSMDPPLALKTAI
ncbi:MAG: YeeE/YedE family protein [Pseudomonadota bacterium]